MTDKNLRPIMIDTLKRVLDSGVFYREGDTAVFETPMILIVVKVDPDVPDTAHEMVIHIKMGPVLEEVLVCDNTRTLILEKLFQELDTTSPEPQVVH